MLPWTWFFHDLTRLPSSTWTSLFAFRSSIRPLVIGSVVSSWANRLLMAESRRVVSMHWSLMLSYRNRESETGQNRIVDMEVDFDDVLVGFSDFIEREIKKHR